jgi:hypothetical protein
MSYPGGGPEGLVFTAFLMPLRSEKIRVFLCHWHWEARAEDFCTQFIPETGGCKSIFGSTTSIL